jgi:hypothetical protein
MVAARAVTSLADGHARIRRGGGPQTRGMDGVPEVLGLELVTGHAGLLADRLRVGRGRIFGERRERETGRRARARTRTAGVVRRHVRRRQARAARPSLLRSSDVRIRDRHRERDGREGDWTEHRDAVHRRRALLLAT